MNQQKIIQTIKIVLAVAVLTIGTTYALAVDWTAPLVQPPGCPNNTPGCDVPINVSANPQIKAGGLGIGGLFSTVGKTVIGHGTAAPTIVDSLKLRIFGKVGAEAYCDQNGNNCIIPPGGGGTATSSGSSFWRQVPSTQTIENTNTGQVNITGKVRITGGKPAADKVLVAQDTTGLARWRYITELTGNNSFVASCGTGKAIQSINENGQVTCIDIQARTTSTGNSFLFTFLSGLALSNILNSGDADTPAGGGCREVRGPAGSQAPYCSLANHGTCIQTGYVAGGGTGAGSIGCQVRLCC